MIRLCIGRILNELKAPFRSVILYLIPREMQKRPDKNITHLLYAAGSFQSRAPHNVEKNCFSIVVGVVPLRYAAVILSEPAVVKVPELARGRLDGLFVLFRVFFHIEIYTSELYFAGRAGIFHEFFLGGGLFSPQFVIEIDNLRLRYDIFLP